MKQVKMTFWMNIASPFILSLLIVSGGKPKTTTPRDMRLKANNPNAGKPKAKPPVRLPKGK